MCERYRTIRSSLCFMSMRRKKIIKYWSDFEKAYTYVLRYSVGIGFDSMSLYDDMENELLVDIGCDGKKTIYFHKLV